MAVDKPAGDTRSQGSGEEAHPAQEPADEDFDQAQQKWRSVHGREKDCEEIQERQA